MLALARLGSAALLAAGLLVSLPQALPAGGEEDACVHLIGYGGAAPAKSSARPGRPSSGRMDAGICSVDNARLNRGTPIKTGADFVPVSGDDGLGFYCVYGVRASATGGIGGNVGIFLFELASGEVLVYGSGYGNIAGANLFDAAYDMERVDQVIRFCMGKTPAETPLRILAPHGHGDHINPACNRELERLGYRIVDIAFHQGDASLVNGMAWTSADRALFRVLPAATTCLQELTSYTSPLGKLWAFERPGHTAGSIDLVLDVRNDPNNRIVVRGSQPSSPCAPVPGQREVINAHGNVELISVAPSVNDLTPLAGSALGGTPLTLSGQSFLAPGAGAHRVFLDGVPATNVVVLNDSTLTCNAPAGPPGQLVDVLVVNNNGKGLYSGSFFYNALPALSSIVPPSGDAAGGTLVEVRGSGFLSAGTNEVLFGTKLGTAISIKSDTLLTCRTPAGSPGASIDVRLRNTNGEAVLAGAFHYESDLAIATLLPLSGTSLGGTTVVLTGTSFTGSGEAPVVTFGGVAATSVTLVSDTSISCVTPRGSAGTSVDVVVTNAAGTASFSAFRYHALPSVTSIAPAVGRASGGTLVTFSGSGFQVDSPGVNQVRFGGIRATQVLVQSNGALTCLAPAGTAGTTVNVTVTNQNGTAALALAYTYTLPVAVNAVTPGSGTSAGGTLVTISGASFQNGPAGTNTVRFGGITASAVTVVDDATLTCVAPAGTPLATVDVQVSNSNGSGTRTAAFRYHARPVLSAVAPDHGHAEAFTPVTLSGTGFLDDEAGAPLVVVGGMTASQVEVLSDTSLVCAIPPGTPGATVDLLLVNQNGEATLAGAFRYHTAPTLTSISPASSPVASQVRVTLSGTGFVNDGAGVPTITFGGVAATAVSVIGEQVVRCNAPVGSAGQSVDVVLTNARGSVTLPGAFRYHARPRVTAVTPERGTFQGGTEVTLSGAGFLVDAAGTNVVSFGGTLASAVVVLNDTSLRCTTPPGLVDDTVDVTVSNSNGAGTLADGFAYSVPPPTIATLAPVSGRADAPGIVTITGSGFLANAAGTNTVTFGGVAASAVAVVDDAKLTCAVPPGAPGTSVVVVVTNANGTVQSAQGFRYHALPVLSALAPAAGSALGGTTVTLTGSGFQADAPGTNQVLFGDVPATGVTVVSDTQLTCLAPAGPHGQTVAVSLSNANGATGAQTFAYHARPGLIALAPDVGPVVGNTSVTLTGSGFLANSAGANRVTFDGFPARSVVVLDDTTLTCLTPPNSSGWADVVVSNANGAATLLAAFHYGKQPPTIATFEPQSGGAGGQNLVTIHGRGFLSLRTGANRVKFGDVLSTNVITVDDETVLCAAPPGAPGASVEVSLNNNNGTAIAAQAYTYHALPTLASVTPDHGPALGTGPITLIGTGFANFSPGTPIVRFGPFTASDVLVLDDTRLTCRVTGSPGKALDVTLQNANGTATLVGAFEIGGPPKLARVQPPSGPFTGGTRVEISGAGFTRGRVDVAFGGSAALEVSVLSDTLLTCVTPPGAMGRKVSVTLRTSYGSASLWNAYTYEAPRPDLIALAPDHGPAAGGTRVTLTGLAFAAEGAGALRVRFGGVEASGVIVHGDTSASCDAPPGQPGTRVDVTLENANGSDLLTSAFRYHDAPVLSALAPAFGRAAGGTSVTLEGRGFLAEGAGANLVLFGGVAASDVLELSDTQLTCTTPPGAPGAGVDVTLANGNGQVTLAAAFTYHATPTLSAVTPDHGPASGALVTLTGTGFQAFEAGTSAVTFGGLAASQVQIVNDTTLTCRVPAGTPGTLVGATVTNANGSAERASAFRYHLEPTLTVLTPNRGPAAGGSTVTLNGSGFLNDDAGNALVFFGAIGASDVVVLSDSALSCRTPGGLAGSLVDVSVRNANGTALRAGAFRYNPLPRLTALSPTSGSALGGTQVTLTGAGFVVNNAGQNTVQFGGVPATSVKLVNDTSLTCVAPAGLAGGTVDVRLSNANGNDTLLAAYRFAPPPVLNALAPTSGSALGGTLVTLTGSGFADPAAGATLVSFAGVPATNVVVLDDTSVQCKTPAGTPGALADVAISNANGQAALAAAFRRHALPSLSGLTPTRGSSSAPSLVTLTGTGFTVDQAGANTVLFGGVPATDVLVLDDTSLSCSVAAQAAGSVVDVSLANANGAALLAAAFAFDAPAPELLALEPQIGLTEGGTSVTLSGTGFLDFSAGTNTVTFGGAAATGVVVVSDAVLTCVTPPGTLGASVDVAVSNANGSDTLAAAFTYVAPAPALTSILPANGRAAGGNTVTLLGSGFQANGAGATTVNFGGQPASAVAVASDGELTCSVPAGTPGSAVDVVLSNANGAATLLAAYRYHLLPTLTSISPANATSLGGTLVTVRGTGFVADGAGTPQVLFGSTPGTSVLVFDDGRLTCRVPSGPAGTSVALTLVNANGSVELASGFRYHARPTLTAVTPSSGSRLGGNRVTLSGSGFQADGASVNIVSFGGVTATSVSVLNDTSLQCNVPAGTSGLSVQVTVANVNGTALLPGGYRYHARPTVTAVSPPNGPAAGGTTVTLTGTGFQVDSPGPNSVTFGGVSASAISALSDTQLTCVTPPGTESTTVDVVLTNANGTGTLFGGFSYDAPALPVLASTSPGRGPTVGSTQVRLSGSGFLPGMSVSFGSTPALDVVVVDEHTIDCLTPASPASAWVDVTLTWSTGSARLPLGFQYVTPPTLTRLEPSVGDPLGGALVVLVGSGFESEAAGTHQVRFDDTWATNVVVLDDQHLACEVPAGPAFRAADVLVTNDNGSAELAGAFRWQRRLATDLDSDGRGDLVLSAPGDDTLGRDAGAVNVFFSTALPLVNQTSAEADLKALPERLSTAFGLPVASGDLDGDGHAELLIGAPGDDLRGRDVGTVYVFGGPLAPSAAPLLATQARTVLFSTRNLDRFGSSLLLRDLDRDGFLDLLVGAPGRTPGTLYVYRGGPAGLGPQVSLLIYGQLGNEGFASSLAAADFDGDGWVDVAVGAPTGFGPVTTSSWQPGEVRIFRGGPALFTTPDPQPWKVIHGQADGDRFGAALAANDLDGDGLEDLVVGASASDRSGLGSGAVWVFRGGSGFASGDAASADAVLDAEAAGDAFGGALAFGDVNDDGRADLLVGAPSHAGSGRAYLFFGSATLASRLATSADAVLEAEAGTLGEFGAQVALVDVDGNGLDDLIVTAPGLDNFGTDLGRVYVFGSAALSQTMQAEDAAGTLTGSGAGDQLGRALSSDR